MCSLTLFIDETIANHATNMMIINNISQAQIIITIFDRYQNLIG
jgi:hypothetical protein